ncbi:MAG TPA: dihydroorotate dehydrogenase [Firmicutes bacterium]|jgi:dihydroorotate dehydrogenase (NAD+) catalytic subunit|nr:dihydroorotate dehydrogenase [Bacillota bacterium]
MPDLKVNIAGVEFKNPVIIASGFFGYGKEYERFYPLSQLGGVTLNGTTPVPKDGSPTPRIAETPAGVLSNTGMPNPGLEILLHEALPQLNGSGTVVIANVAAGTADDFARIAGLVSESCADMIEINLAAANIENSGLSFGVDAKSVESVVKKVRIACTKSLIVKLPPHLTQIPDLAKAAEAEGADAVSLIGTVFGMRIDIQTRHPLLKSNTGGLSGRAIFPLALRMVWQAANAVKIPVIGIGGISRWQDAAEMLLAGAKAVEVGSALFSDPFAPIQIIDGISNYLSDNNLRSISDLSGRVECWK